MDPHRRPVRDASRLALLVAAALLLVLPAPAPAFDTGPHTDMTRDAMAAEGFGLTATDVVVVNNWLTDLYFNSQEDPAVRPRGPEDRDHRVAARPARELAEEGDSTAPSGCTSTRRSGTSSTCARRSASSSAYSARRPRRSAASRPTAGPGVRRGCSRRSGSCCTRCRTSTRTRTGSSSARSTEPTARTGRGSSSGYTPTFFDVPEADRNGLNVYIGDSTFHDDRTHGAWNTERNKTMKAGVNKDWPGRARLHQRLHRPPTSPRANGCARSAPRSATRRSWQSHAALRQPAPGRARPRPQGRAEDRDDDRPLAGPGRAVRPVDLAERLRSTATGSAAT